MVEIFEVGCGFVNFAYSFCLTMGFFYLGGSTVVGLWWW